MPGSRPTGLPPAAAGYKPIVALIVKRCAILCLIVAALAAFFWAVGSFRSFLEETQLMLLGVLRAASIGLAVVSAAGILVSLLWSLLGRRFGPLAGIFGYAILAALGLAGLLLAEGLAALSRGIG